MSLDLVLGIVNTSWKRQVDAGSLLACLRGGGEPEEWKCHLLTFFTEVSIEQIHGLMLDHGLDAATLRRVFERVAKPLGGENPALEVWLGEMEEPAEDGPDGH